MQLKHIILPILILFSAPVISQEDSSKVKKEPIDIYFVSSYYEQDGNHSPVTGGTGTEKLTNIAPTVYVHIPLDTARSIDINAGVDFYSSASSDNIDNPYVSPNHVSGASSSDVRQYYSFTYAKENEKRITNSYTAGISSEYDVTSFSAGYTFDKKGKKNFDFRFGAKYFFDDWKLIYPVELRNGTQQLLSVDKRHTLGITLSESFIINKRLKGSITTEPLTQFGLLSTPFHRVYFQNNLQSSIEMLPEFRAKVPIALRLNAYLGNNLVIRSFNRFYQDNWGISAYTFELEMPYSVSSWLTLSPIYRFHTQTQANYFAAFAEHNMLDQYFTSDFDLSGFSSHKMGMGLSLKPLFGVARFKRRNSQNILKWETIDLRYVYYDRSDGLTAWNITGGFKFSLER